MTPSGWRRLVDVLTGLPLPVVLPLHPRTDARLRSRGAARPSGAAPRV